MRYLCEYCKHHQCGEEKNQACTCALKHQMIEHWYFACNRLFKDRRENDKAWTGMERRRPVQMTS